MRAVLAFFSRYGVWVAFGWSMLFLQPLMAQTATTAPKAYARIYIENRCYHTVELVFEQEKKEVALPSVSPRETEIVYFNWAKSLSRDELLRFNRKDAPPLHLSMQTLLDNARHEQWTVGSHVLDSWIYTTCPKELPLNDVRGSTVRPADAGERVAEYELFFSRVLDSTDPMHIYGNYPVRVSLNGIPLHVLNTGNDGVLRLLLPADMTGTMTLEALPDETRTRELGLDWQPVKVRKAKKGEKLLVLPNLRSSGGDW